MRDINISAPKENRSLIVGMNFFAFLCIVGFQALIILSVGYTITWIGVIIFLLELAMYYISQYWIIPLAFDKDYKPRFFLRLSFLIACYVLVRGWIVYNGKIGIPFLKFMMSFEQVIYVTEQLIVVLGLSFFMALYRRNNHLWIEYVKAISATLEANAEKSRVESISLQMRQSPHLSFNVLNYIKVNSSRDPVKLENAVDLYSEILRHTLIDIKEVKTVSLAAEIVQVKNMIQLYRILSDDKFYVDLKEDYLNADMDAMIPPATLLTLIENIAKYAVVYDEDYPASVAVSLHGRSFKFNTNNYKRRHSDPGTGLGIKSIESTLNYYYLQTHTLIIEDSEDTFSLTLTIQL